MTYVRLPSFPLPSQFESPPPPGPQSSQFINSTKLSIYATLNQKVTDHKTILSERAKVLEDVQRGLLKDGAVLI